MGSCGKFSPRLIVKTPKQERGLENIIQAYWDVSTNKVFHVVYFEEYSYLLL